MLRRLPALLPLALACALASGAPAAAPEDGRSFKDWTVRCRDEAQGEGADRACFIVQDVLLKSQNRRLLLVTVGYLASGEQPAAFFTLPLGVSLPGGISIRVDDGKPTRLRYERCDRSGCLAPLALSDELLAAFKGGRWARVAFFDPNGREVSVPVSLLGFTAGFESLAQ